MYVDEYRLRKGPKDNAPVCWCDAYMFPHRVNSLECKQREEWILDQAVRPPSRHSPLVHRHTIDVPF